MQNGVSFPLSNLQLELLKLFAQNVADQDLIQIKLLIAQYLAQKSSELADKVWEEKGLSPDMILNRHFRTTYSSSNL
ncbi:MAG: hypothetical protein EAZ97_15265 [Bacteroidetes bacterium]|nr:MAG: hypothetical protein EAZ97_15265 [Bacteroidota bacterium]